MDRSRRARRHLDLVNVGIAVLHARIVEAGATRAEITNFVNLQYRVHALVPGGAPPNVRQGSTVPDTAPTGTLFIAHDCDALYMRQGGKWRVLERGPRGGSFPLRIRFPGSPTPLPQPLVVVGTTHPIVVTAQVLAGNHVVFSLNGLFRSPSVHVTPGRDHDVDIVIDPNLQRTSVKLDGRAMLSMTTPNVYFPAKLPPLDSVTVGRNQARFGIASKFGGSLRLLPTSMSVCRRLARQL